MNIEWQQYQEKFSKEVESGFNWLHAEYNKIRAGRASPNLVSGVKIVAYNSLTSLNEVANVQTPEPRVLVIKPYDPDLIKEIAKAINKHNDELNPVVDGKIIRIIISPPTEEGRKKSVKLIKEHLEKTKIAIRNARKNIQTAIKNAKYQEGLEQAYLENLDKAVKKANEEAEQIFKAKEKELLTI